MMKLAKHLPSQMNIAVHRALPSYGGQPVTCYGWGDSGHINQVCSRRRAGGMATSDSTPICGPMSRRKAPKPARHCLPSNWGEPPERVAWPGIGSFPTVDDLKPTNAPPDTGGEQQDPHSPTKAWYEAPGRWRKSSRLHNLYWPPRSVNYGRWNDGIWR